MILVDTSVWIEHLRHGDEFFKDLFQENICIHPMVIGELACGNLRNRNQLLKLWSRLPSVVVASHEEVIMLLNRNNLAGKGIGYIDAHLLASAKIETDILIWTMNKRLAKIAESLNLLYVLKFHYRT
ncbi:MAG: type II toxin-antitoxin system VapC family toxin [Gammaproteobacteria bacterium]|nr:type II toxin-antitoxin system VapC family toxin [Gammaproteobacteria bacterium]